MMRRIIVLLFGILFSMSCVSCQKEAISPVAGTSWEGIDEGDIMMIVDNSKGIYYCKSSIDDVKDEEFSSFEYVFSGKNIKALVTFSRMQVLYNYEIIDENTMMSGLYTYKRIQPKP